MGGSGDLVFLHKSQLDPNQPRVDGERGCTAKKRHQHVTSVVPNAYHRGGWLLRPKHNRVGIQARFCFGLGRSPIQISVAGETDVLESELFSYSTLFTT